MHGLRRMHNLITRKKQPFTREIGLEKTIYADESLSTGGVIYYGIWKAQNAMMNSTSNPSRLPPRNINSRPL